MELVQIYFKFFNTKFLAFFVIFQIFHPGSGSRREKECGSLLAEPLPPSPTCSWKSDTQYWKMLHLGGKAGSR